MSACKLLPLMWGGKTSFTVRKLLILCIVGKHKLVQDLYPSRALSLRLEKPQEKTYFKKYF